MDYAEAFKSLKTNNKYGRKSPHKAILLLTVIELYETNVLSDNVILYDETLKNAFIKVWERTLREEPLFHPEVYFPFWYMQTEDFWHIVPIRGKEDVLALMRDTNVKPSEAKLIDCVRYAELDEDLYFLMTIPSGRSSLKRALLETYTDLSESQIDKFAQSMDNTVDHSISALADYERILSKEEKEVKTELVKTDDEKIIQFQKLGEDLQIMLNLQYFSFLKSHRNEREMFKEFCPTVYDLFDRIVSHPIKQGEISPSFAITYGNFLSDLKISLLSEEDSISLIDKIVEALDLLWSSNIIENAPTSKTELLSNDELEIEDVHLDSRGKVIKIAPVPLNVNKENTPTENSRKGKTWTEEEEQLIKDYFSQGKGFSTIATLIGRSEVAVKLRLAKLGLIDYTYEPTNVISPNNQYSERKQAILQAMRFFRSPATVKDITGTISRTMWGTSDVKEEDVELILSTLSEVVHLGRKYILKERM